MARRLIRREGLLCGGSSGSAFDLRAARRSRFRPRSRASGLLCCCPTRTIPAWAVPMPGCPSGVGSLDLRAPLTVAPDVSVSENPGSCSTASPSTRCQLLTDGPAAPSLAWPYAEQHHVENYSRQPGNPPTRLARRPSTKFTKVTPDAKLGAV
uniref:Uncharacterized protein n=1 Tax=Macrostomum lignano TaxID=282301 RepID=A0A1I8FCT2_9PLAT